MFALTRWRLVHGYPNERKATHESTCGACPPRFCSFLPSSVSLFLSLPLSLFLAYDPGGPRFCYLPVLLLTAHRPIVGDPRAALKGLAQFSTRDSTRLDGPGRFQVGEVKITTRHQRRFIVIRRRMWENNRDEYYRSLRGKSVSVVVVTLASSTDDGFTVFRERRYLKKSTRDCMNSPLKMRVAVSFADTHVVWPAKMIRIA